MPLVEQHFPAVPPNASSFVASYSVVTLAPSEDKVWIALSNGGIEVHDAYSGSICHFFQPPKHSTDTSRPWCLLAVRLDDHEEQMWIGLSTGVLEVLNCHDYSVIRQLRKHISGIYCLASDRHHVFAGSSDFSTTQWRISDGQLMRVYNGHTNYVRCIYAEGSSFFSGSDDFTIRLWNSTSGECQKVLAHHAGSGGVSALCRVGVNMWSGDSNGLLVRWSLKNPDRVIGTTTLGSKRIIAIELVGNHVYVSSSEGSTDVLLGLTGEIVNHFSTGATHLATVRCVAEIDRMFFWSGASDNTVRCWHYDEYHSMSEARQRQNDMGNFYCAQQPYAGKNSAAIDQLLDLKELCSLADGGEKAIETAATEKQIDLMSKSAQALILASTLNNLNKQFETQDSECRRLHRIRVEKEKALEALQAKLRNLETAVQTLQKADPEVVNTILKWAAPPVAVPLPP